MKLPQILSMLRTEPLFCSNEYRSTLLDLFEQHAAMDKQAFRSARTGIAKSGSLLDIEEMEIKDGIAYIPIGGPIGINLGEFEKGAGAVDLDNATEELDEAESNDEVEQTVINFDTPGGMVCGTPEFAKRIMAAEKPIWAWSRGNLCSAGFFLASACDGIFASPTAIVGNIGVSTMMTDLTKMADIAGVKVKVFASGPYKGMGTPGTALTATQELFLQARVMELAEMFYSHVRENRGQIADADMQGQFYSGDQALEKGFVDAIFNDLNEMVAFLK